ncbi:MAG: hypothetical protein A2X28_06870 [Elusimicrobia bacterium GWA2_56_46]|nr:MAG: hypothetical protein A2X28_06870 [Elusimicrobia bacterium GWA2_56_46]OGR54827.1 MAG: hypothetical protein A2X39_11120 [Elusimicrobia bacterium GWC2_56_31]
MSDKTNLILSTDKVYLLPRNPSAFFICWTWGRSRAEAFEAREYESEILVRLSVCEDKAVSGEASVRWDSGKLYMKPPAEGRTCSVSVYGRRKDGAQEKLLESNSVAAPVPAPAPETSSGYSSAEFFRKEPV